MHGVLLSHRLESLNEKRSGVVQMVKLAEKERDALEVRMCSTDSLASDMIHSLSDMSLTRK